MADFIGDYEVAVDPKGRFLLPIAVRKQIAEGVPMSFVINRGFDNCLNIQLVSDWQTILEKIKKLDDFVPEERDLKRLYLSGATAVELDSADRMLIPKLLLDYAGIKKDAILSSQCQKLELWDKDKYNNYFEQKTGNYSEIASKVAANSKNQAKQLLIY